MTHQGNKSKGKGLGGNSISQHNSHIWKDNSHFVEIHKKAEGTKVLQALGRNTAPFPHGSHICILQKQIQIFNSFQAKFP